MEVRGGDVLGRKMVAAELIWSMKDTLLLDTLEELNIFTVLHRLN